MVVILLVTLHCLTQAVHKSDCLVDPAVSEEYTNDEVYYYGVGIHYG